MAEVRTEIYCSADVFYDLRRIYRCPFCGAESEVVFPSCDDFGVLIDGGCEHLVVETVPKVPEAVIVVAERAHVFFKKE